MDTVEITIDQYQRLMDALLWVLGPYLESGDPLSEYPHLFELGECYNELYHKMPRDREHNYPELIFS